MAGAPSGARRGVAKLITISLSQGSGTGMDNRNDIWLGVDAIKPRFIALSDKVWAMPEVCYTEARSSAEHLAELRHQGFRIAENVAGIPTAVMGEWGEGGPVIAFLGEYDALPGLSQEADVAEPRPLEAGGHGHGCGHNLLGSAALLAATAVKDWLATHNVPGRVRYYGCQAQLCAEGQIQTNRRPRQRPKGNTAELSFRRLIPRLSQVSARARAMAVLTRVSVGSTDEANTS